MARQVEDMFNVDKQAETEKIRKSKREKSKELNGGGFATQGVFTIDGIDEELMTTYHPAFLKELLKNYEEGYLKDESILKDMIYVSEFEKDYLKSFELNYVRKV